MGLLSRIERERHTRKSEIKLSPAEAAVALAALVSFADDDPSEAEGVVLRTYYRFSTAESLQNKLTLAGYSYPDDLDAAEETIIRALLAASKPARRRALAVGWLLASADGFVDQSEMNLLSRYTDALHVSLADVRGVAERGLREVDELVDDELAGIRDEEHIDDAPELSISQASIALAAWVGFADDNPSDAEAAIIREHYDYNEVRETIRLLQNSATPYPDGLPRLGNSILRALGSATRTMQVKALAIADKVAGADGEHEEAEELIVRHFCEELCIGLAEVRDFFMASSV